MTFQRALLFLATLALLIALYASAAYAVTRDPCKGPGAQSNPKCRANNKRQAPPARRPAPAARRGGSTSSSKIADSGGLKRVPPKRNPASGANNQGSERGAY
jgi:hypothetical protein